MPRRRIEAIKYLTVLVLTVLIFSIGVFVGSSVTKGRLSAVVKMQDQLRLELLGMELEDALLAEHPCVADNLAQKLDDLAVQITHFEGIYGKDDERVTELKKPYSLLLIRHYLRLKKEASYCNSNRTLVLYFYSNEPDKIEICEKQGFILGYLQKKYGYDRVKVYAFDADLDLEVLKTLMQIYNISETPSVVIGDKVYVGEHSREELELLVA